tara:strand:- start:254 stop:832 length:579 start_codon:yes stop_codon:yes gene_type:complete
VVEIKESFVIVDIETTGLSKHRHKITEISAIKFQNGEIIDEFNTLINPETKIPKFITKLTGINNEMVKDSPKIHEVINDFHDFTKDSHFVAHNATFDYNFLNHNLKQHTQKELTNNIICTCKLARRLLPELPNKKLGTVCEHLDIGNYQAHRARGDAIATTFVFKEFLQRTKAEEISHLLKIQKASISSFRC